MLRTRLRSLRSQTQTRIPLYLQLTSIKSIRASTSDSNSFIRNNKLSLNNLPVEVLIRIFALLVEPVDALQVWRNCPDKSQLSWDGNYNEMNVYTMNEISEAERCRKVLRLTCKMWNTIVLESVVEWNIDIGRIMVSSKLTTTRENIICIRRTLHKGARGPFDVAQEIICLFGFHAQCLSLPFPLLPPIIDIYTTQVCQISFRPSTTCNYE